MIRPRRAAIARGVVAAAAAASTDGVGVKLIAKTIGCSQPFIQRELRKAGHPGCYTGATLPVEIARRAASKHVPLLKAALEKADRRLQPSLKHSTPRVYAPLAQAMGIRIYTRPDGISLPYLPSLYGEVRG